MRRLTSVLPSLMALLVGACSFAISYNTLRLEAVAVQAVPDGWPSYLVPLILDGAVVSGSAVLWKASAQGRPRQWFPFLFVGALVALSVVVNVAHAGQTPLARAIAALPPLVLLGCLELVVISHRGQVEDARDAAAAPVPVEVPVAVATPEPGSAPAPASVQAAVPTPAVIAHEPAAATVVVTEGLPFPGTGADGAPELATGPVAAQAAPSAAAPSAAAPTQPVEAPARMSTPALVGTPAPVAAPSAPVAQFPTPAAAPARAGRTRPTRTRAAAPGEPAPVVAAASAGDGPAGASAADRIRELFVGHLSSGGRAGDPGLARQMAQSLDVSEAYARRVLGQLRRELEPAL